MFMTPLYQHHASHTLASRAYGPQPQCGLKDYDSNEGWPCVFKLILESHGGGGGGSIESGAEPATHVVAAAAALGWPFENPGPCAGIRGYGLYYEFD